MFIGNIDTVLCSTLYMFLYPLPLLLFLFPIMFVIFHHFYHTSFLIFFNCMIRVHTPCARIRAHTPTVGAAVYTVAGCAQRICAHTPTVAVKVQTCCFFKASADQRRHSSQSRKRSKFTEGRHVVLHRNVCGRIPTHTLACLLLSTAQLALCSGDAQAAASVDICAGCRRIRAHGV